MARNNLNNSPSRREQEAIKDAKGWGAVIGYKKAWDVRMRRELIVVLRIDDHQRIRYLEKNADPGADPVGKIVQARYLNDLVHEGSKMRAEAVHVIDIQDMNGRSLGRRAVAFSDYASWIAYRVGHRVEPDGFSTDKTLTCGKGIHFYLHKEDARCHTL